MDTKEATIWDGQKVAAQVKVGNKTHNLFADGVQPFQRVYIKPEERVDITVNYSEEEAGDPVVIQVEDGGLLDEGKIAKVGKLDDKRNLAFSFQSSPNNGIHRVTLWRSTDRKVLDFWAGDPLPVAGQ